MRPQHSTNVGLRAAIRFLICLVVSLALSGCSTIGSRLAEPSPQVRARVIDSQLAAADWSAVKPQTPQQAQYLRSLAPLLMHDRIGDDGRLHFWMADPYNCDCMFYGNQAEYARYQIIRRHDESVALEERDSTDYAATKWSQRTSGLPWYIGGGFGGVPPHMMFP
jgi:uncharacterized protein YceK